MNGRAFNPYVGSEYWSKGIGEARLLVLGESHYGDYDLSGSCGNFTSSIVHEWALTHRAAFFTKTAKIVNGFSAGQILPLEEKISTWNKICFYNYIQSLLPHARQAPTKEMWTAARTPFLNTVEELQPHLIIVLGHRLRDNLPPIPKNIESVVTMHPSSSRFKYEETNDILKQKLNVIQSKLKGDI